MWVGQRAILSRIGSGRELVQMQGQAGFIPGARIPVDNALLHGAIDQAVDFRQKAAGVFDFLFLEQSPELLDRCPHRAASLAVLDPARLTLHNPLLRGLRVRHTGTSPSVVKASYYMDVFRQVSTMTRSRWV